MTTTRSPSNPIAQSRDDLERIFADRPRLEAVAEHLLQQALAEDKPTLAVRVGGVRIARILVPAAEGKLAVYGPLMSLSEALLRRVKQGRLMNLTASVHGLLVRRGRESWVPLTASLSVDDLEVIINRVAPQLLDAFQAQLLDYWSAQPDQDPLSTRWRMVADQLRSSLMHGPQFPPLSASERQQVLGRFYAVKADRERFLGEGVLRVFQVFAREEGGAGEWLVVLLIEYRATTVSTYYLFSPSSGVQRLTSLDDLASLLPLHMSRHSGGRPVAWAVREPEGDVFDDMAHMLLEKQLRDLSAIRWSDFPDTRWYRQRFHQLTSPAAWFGGVPGGAIAEPALPAWLQGAEAVDRRHASRLLDALRLAQVAAGGAGFLDGIEPIHVYACRVLQTRMRQDHPQEVAINPDDYTLTFTRTQGGTVGWTESSTRTLTEWALDNPFTDPYAQVQIRNRAEPGYIPDWWFTLDYVKRLIPSVDIGQHYPQMLRRKLLDDPVEVRRRLCLFSAQTRAQLPLVALEAVVRANHGVSRTGLRWIEAVVQQTVEGRHVDGHDIVARPLAFLTHSGSRAYVAANMFVIGPRDDALQPHVLYQPAAAVPLREWASRQALLRAIAAPGDLQNAVLESLDPQGRALLGNGGFLQPHTQRVGQGDEFAPVRVPTPALLSDQTVPGDFLTYVFRTNAQALVARAEQQSRSNADQRWEAFRNDLGQLFSVVLPLLRGPLATAGWLYQSLLSATALVALPQTGDDPRRATAIAQAVADLAGLLLYPAAGLDERLQVAGIEPQPPVTRPAAQVGQPVALSTLRSHTSADITSMEFGWRSAGALSVAQQNRLNTYKWRQGEQPWPVVAQNIETAGRHKGLVRVPAGTSGWQLHAYIDGGLYPVADTVDGMRVVDSHQPGRFGPWLKRDSAGVWQFDLKLRLAGGMPRSSGAARRAAILRREEDLKQLYNQQTDALVVADDKAHKEHAYYVRVHETERERFTDALRQRISERYLAQLREQYGCQVQRLDTLRLRNANKPIPGFEQELSLQLQDVVHTLQACAALLILARKAVTPPRSTLQAWSAQLGSEDLREQQQAHDGTVGYLSKIAEFNQQLIDLSTQEHAYVSELKQVPGFELETSRLAETAPTRPLPLDWKTNQVSVLRGLMLKRAPAQAEFYDFIMLKELTDLAVWAARSHRALQEPGFLGAGEQVQALDHVIGQYAQVSTSLGFYQRALAELLEGAYVSRLNALIEDLRAEAEHALALLLREMNRTPVPVPEPAPVPSTGRRMVRTRDKRILVGQVRARTPEEPEEIVDVVDPVDNAPVASYRQSPEKDIWEELDPPSRAPLPPARSTRRLLADARSLLQQASKNIRDAWRDADSSNSPIGLESALTDRARQLEALRGSLQQHAPAEEQVLSELEAAAQRMREQGRLIRIAVIKRNPPEPSRIQYLKEQGEVEIVKLEGRVKLARPDDYLQEYLIRDLGKQPLAYAHFHYRTETAALEAFTAGHLKSPGQRFKSFVIGEGQTEGQYLTVHRAQINTALARSLFFAVETSVQRGASLRYW